MLGVDFVIRALFEISGVRAGGWAKAMVRPMTSNAETHSDELLGRTESSVIAGGEAQSGFMIRIGYSRSPKALYHRSLKASPQESDSHNKQALKGMLD